MASFDVVVWKVAAVEFLYQTRGMCYIAHQKSVSFPYEHLSTVCKTDHSTPPNYRFHDYGQCITVTGKVYSKYPLEV
jgi:hypothetical protein